MSNFYARTRLRGEISYYRAAWLDNCFGNRGYGVRFEEGPHSGRVYPGSRCQIAKEEYQQKEMMNEDV